MFLKREWRSNEVQNYKIAAVRFKKKKMAAVGRRGSGAAMS